MRRLSMKKVVRLVATAAAVAVLGMAGVRSAAAEGHVPEFGMPALDRIGLPGGSSVATESGMPAPDRIGLPGGSSVATESGMPAPDRIGLPGGNSVATESGMPALDRIGLPGGE
jgi:hypothetical protein